jgi:hypothetical protein
MTDVNDKKGSLSPQALKREELGQGVRVGADASNQARVTRHDGEGVKVSAVSVRAQGADVVKSRPVSTGPRTEPAPRPIKGQGGDDI